MIAPARMLPLTESLAPFGASRSEWLDATARQTIVNAVLRVWWLETAEVRESLTLSSQQIQDTQTIAGQVRQWFRGLQNMDPQEREWTIRNRWLPAARSIDQRLRTILTRQQYRRLFQWNKGRLHAAGMTAQSEEPACPAPRSGGSRRIN